MFAGMSMGALGSALLAQIPNSGSLGLVILVVGGLVFLFFVFVLLYASRYTKVGPNEVLVISGKKHEFIGPDGVPVKVGFRIVKGGGTFVWPIFERCDILSLEMLTLDVKTPEVYTTTGVPIIVDGVAQIKIKGDDVSVRTAAEQFLSKSRTELMSVALQTLEGHLRAIIGALTVEEIYKDREAFAQRVQEVAASDLQKMGLQIVSFSLREIRDNRGYLDALGVKRTAEVKRDARIGEAEADRDATIRSAAAYQVGQEAKFVAETKVAEASKGYEMKKADYQADINTRRAESDLAYDLQKYKKAQEVKAEEIQVTIIEKQKQVAVQEQEIARKQKELDATVSKPADAEKYRMETIANATKFKLETEAHGQAEATRSVGVGQAEAEKAKGLAEAAVIQAKGMSQAQVTSAIGQAEALAMSKKAEAWRAYNEAAIAQMLIEKLPELARAIAEPLSKTEKIVIISNGGDAAGASKITKDITNIIAQLPPVLEAVAGVNLKDIIERIPKLSGKGDSPKA
jgi:flotillin